MGDILIKIGLFIVLFGLIFKFLPKTGTPFLPGDILIQKENFTFFFPIATSLLISLILTILINLFNRK